jgi:hypothetical protein
MKKLLAVAVLALLSTPAMAQTTIGPGGGTGLGEYQIGPDRGFIGQSFTSPGGLLTDFTYTAGNSDGGLTKFVVSSYDGNTFGQPLFSRLVTLENGLTNIGGINLATSSNQLYVAYLTNIGVTGAAGYVGVAAYYPTSSGPFTNAFLGGDATAYEVTTDPAGQSNFQPDTFSDIAFTATFSPVISAIPEPATWAMMLLGFGAIGAAARYRRRKTNVAFA